ncbi:MAG: hypothetical protein JSU67_00685 [Gammaproteobacteria bacterium]|nr:MAG: hypothetical protein JSU67_00685 [Gammaproteobacteria bacterium]
MEDELPRKLAAIFYADVVDYSRLTGDDEETTHRHLSRYLDVLTNQISEHGGRVVHYAGDAVLADFGTVTQAVEAATSIQNNLFELNKDLPSDRRVKFRIGINLGEVIEDRGDIYGNDVNVAARLEKLADPGGVCISEAVRSAVGNKLPLNYEFMGEQKVKNIKAPVRAYQVRLSTENPPETIVEEHPEIELPKQPSLAVLPFDNMSGDLDQEYFCDGITEEITTAIGKVQSFFVVSRNSAFAFKGKHIDVKLVSQQLGVRYLLEGSVRKSGDRLRITAQLIDGVKDRHVWADRYDGSLGDVFDLQDQVVESVAGAIEPKLRSSEMELSRKKPTSNLNAYDLFLRALSITHSMTRDGNNEALRLTARAIKLDDRYASAMALAAWCYTLRVAQGWVESKEDEEQEALRLSRLAIEIENSIPETLWLAGYVLGFFGESPEEGLDHIDHALEINPNSSQALVFSGWLRIYNGDAETAKAQFEKAIRLSPLDLSAYRSYAGIGFACLCLGEIEEAIEWASRALRQNPKFTPAHRVLASSLGHAGRLQEAGKTVQQLLSLVPGLTIGRYSTETRFRNPEYFEIIMDGLRKAGLPE